MNYQEQTRNLLENFINLLAPTYGPLKAKEGADDGHTIYWWVEQLGQYEPAGLRAAAAWWKNTDKSLWWPRTPAVVEEWLKGHSYGKVPDTAAIQGPSNDPLGAWRKDHQAAYLRYVIEFPKEPADQSIAWMLYRKQAYEMLLEEYRQQHPEIRTRRTGGKGEVYLDWPHWSDVSTMAFRDGWFDKLLPLVLALQQKAIKTPPRSVYQAPPEKPNAIRLMADELLRQSRIRDGYLPPDPAINQEEQVEVTAKT